MGATEEIKWIAIHQNGELHRRDAMRYPIEPFLTESAPSQQIE
jgi:hypothetical protein